MLPHPLAWQVVFENSGDAYDHSRGNQQYLLTDSETIYHRPTGMWQQHVEQLYFSFAELLTMGFCRTGALLGAPSMETPWQLRGGARASIFVDTDA